MSEFTIICAGCGKPFEMFKEGDSRLCYTCSRRESLEEIDYDWLPSVAPKVWEKPTPRSRR